MKLGDMPLRQRWWFRDWPPLSRSSASARLALACSVSKGQLAFVGTSIYVFHQLTETLAPEQALGTLFGSMIVCSLLDGFGLVCAIASGVCDKRDWRGLMVVGLSLVWSSTSSLASIGPGAGCVGSRFSWPVAAIIIVSMLVPLLHYDRSL